MAVSDRPVIRSCRLELMLVVITSAVRVQFHVSNDSGPGRVGEVGSRSGIASFVPLRCALSEGNWRKSSYSE